MCYEDNTKDYSQSKNHASQACKTDSPIFEAPEIPPKPFLVHKPLCQAVVTRGENSTSVGGRSVPVLTLESYPPEAIKVGDPVRSAPSLWGLGVPLNSVCNVRGKMRTYLYRIEFLCVLYVYIYVYV